MYYIPSVVIILNENLIRIYETSSFIGVSPLRVNSNGFNVLISRLSHYSITVSLCDLSFTVINFKQATSKGELSAVEK